jgi:tight adherence protein B
MTPSETIMVLVGAVAAGTTAATSLIGLAPVWDRLALRRIGERTRTWHCLGLDPVALKLGLRLWGLLLLTIFATAWWWLQMPPVAIVSTLLIYLGLPWVIDELLLRRRVLLRDQIVASASCLARHSEAGAALGQGLEAVAREVANPLAQQFRRIVFDYEHGQRLADAVQAARERLQLESFSLFAAAIQVTLVRGGRINEALARISHSLQENQRLERKIAADTASGRRVVQLLAFFPLGFLLMLQFMAPNEVRLLYTTFVGNVVLALALLIEYAGIRLALRVVRPD